MTTATPIVRIERIDGDKSAFMPLLLIGDESAEMIGRYLDSGELYAAYSGDSPIAVCVVTTVEAGVCEVKNLAVRAEFRRKGIGHRMLSFVEGINAGKKMILGTGETPSTLRFYRSCGYEYSHRIPHFFKDNYPEPIVEEGVTLDDMVYLAKQL